MQPCVKQHTLHHPEIEGDHRSLSPHATNIMCDEVQLWAGECTSPVSIGNAPWTETRCSSSTGVDTETSEWVTCTRQLLHTQRANPLSHHHRVEDDFGGGQAAHALQRTGCLSHLWRDWHSDTSRLQRPFSSRPTLARMSCRASAAAAGRDNESNTAAVTSHITKSHSWHVTLTTGVSNDDEKGEGFMTVECLPPKPSGTATTIVQFEYAAIIDHLTRVVSPLSCVIHAVFYYDVDHRRYLPLTHETAQYAGEKYRVFVIPVNSLTPQNGGCVTMPLPERHRSTPAQFDEDALSIPTTMCATVPSTRSTDLSGSDSFSLWHNASAPSEVCRLSNLSPTWNSTLEGSCAGPAVPSSFVQTPTQASSSIASHLTPSSYPPSLPLALPWPPLPPPPTIFTYAEDSTIDRLQREIQEGMERLRCLTEDLPAIDRGQSQRVQR